jgi:triacylglycerol lipase
MVRMVLARRQLLRRGLGLGAAALGGIALAGDVMAVAGMWRPRVLTAPDRSGASALLSPPLVVGGGSDLSRPPIIFVHGNSNSSSLWLAQAWRFEAHGWPRDQLVAIDHPYPTARDDDTVPQSDRSGSAEQRAQLVAAIEATRARTGASKVVLIGSSRGGNAIRNALKHGGVAPRVSHAILRGTPSHGAYRSDNDRNEFNGNGPVLRDLNSGGEVVPGVPYLTIRSDTNDLYAQPGGGGYDGPALAGATNVVIPGLDHNETATSALAFAAMLRFVTGEEASGAIPVEETVTLNGRVTGFLGAVPTNLGVAGVAVTVYALDPATGTRRGDPLLARTTGPDGVWGPLTTDARTPLEFVVAAPGEPPRHTFRSPFPRSSAYVGLRLWPDVARADAGTLVFTRPRGYIAGGRDVALLDDQPLPNVPDGLPTEGSFTIPLAGPERAVPVSLNDEAFVARSIPGAISYAEFHY